MNESFILTNKQKSASINSKFLKKKMPNNCFVLFDIFYYFFFYTTLFLFFFFLLLPFFFRDILHYKFFEIDLFRLGEKKKLFTPIY
ncbi:hypothetical protein HANVADRAFT_91230 [Hanseniaspora valbyensis NRRL Y-1626]|uniref:Uncharacterized protein n=1 Tax=Hanseniaspora valbyensis NRRL Y-1626 TaxID=766949 RepID=A0A1B7T8G2_9ASCO|nr:hypothetical protein HANVADRAFT_91230 [Hanseniaspora valbyensis NRRL Y-1626]